MAPIRFRRLASLLLAALLFVPSVSAASDEPLLWVAYEPGVLVAFDVSLSPVRRIAAPGGRLNLASAPDGTLFAAGLGGIIALDTRSRQADSSWFLPDSIGIPLQIEVSPDGQELWVLGLGGAGQAAALAVVPIDGVYARSETADTGPLGALPGAMTFSRDGSSLWIALTSEHALVEIDVATRTEKQRIEMGARALPEALEFGVLGTLYVTDLGGALWFVDSVNGVLLSRASVGRAAGLAVSNGGGYVYVTDSANDSLLVFDAITGEQLDTVRLRRRCSAPGRVVITDDDLDLLIACTGSTNLLRLRTTGMEASAMRNVPGGLLRDLALTH